VAVKPAPQAVAQGEARVALVIGNGAYQDSPLKNPVNDARAMGRALRECGFQVIALENASYQKMREGLRDFGGRIAQGGVGLFYFAGHGMQVKGKNYLIPIGADIKGEDEVAGEAMDVDQVLAKLETARNRLNILILDACRNNPFGRSFRGGQTGLAPLDAPMGTYIAFATAPGRIAADGSGQNGLYTEQLLKAMRRPGMKLEETFKLVLAGVRRDSRDQQVPWTASSVEGDFYFVPGNAPAAAAPGPARNVRGLLGVGIQNLSPDLVKAFNLAGSQGALVCSVVSGSPAQQAGVKVGDVVLTCNGLVVLDSSALRELVASTAPGTRVPLEVMRDGKAMTLVVVMGEAPEAVAAAPEPRPAPAQLGIHLLALTADLAKRYGLAESSGVLVGTVDPGSPAAQAGLQEGDLILEVNRKPVTRPGDVPIAKAEGSQRDCVLLLLKRGTASLFVVVPLS
jgi:hypothetical protein